MIKRSKVDTSYLHRHLQGFFLTNEIFRFLPWTSVLLQHREQTEMDRQTGLHAGWQAGRQEGRHAGRQAE
jgi:hypothetical protein